MMQFNLDETPYRAEITYTDSDNTKQTLTFDVVEAHDFFATLGSKYPDTNGWESHEAINQEMRAWLAEEFGHEKVPSAILLQIQGAIRAAYEEFKKKLDPTLSSQIFTESTPSTLQQLKEGHLKLASQGSSPNENLDTEEPKASSPPKESTR